MTNLVEPRRAADVENDADIGSFGDGELATLVRRWMAAGTKVQERVRRESVLRVAPEPGSDELVEETTDPVDAAEPADGVADEAADDVVVEAAVEPADEAVVEVHDEVHDEMDDEHSEIEAAVEAAVALSEAAAAAEAGAEIDVESEAQAEVEAVPAPELHAAPRLPHRPTQTEVEQATRVAVLIDARRVPEEVATALLAKLHERGAVNVCRAYADWSRADLGDWVARLRLQGLHSFHQFSDDDDQALVALAIDAVDIARDAAVDEVVIAGDMTSLLPLVHRLHAAGVRVVVVGPAHTPHDVRAACDEFIDSGAIGADDVAPAGRHRA